jgi:prepilin-type N-terminal cleavage/methylation domain-containing protein
MYKLERSKKMEIWNHSGFTLVEVLISILLLAFISLQTFKLVDNSTNTKENVLREDRALLQSLIATGRLDSDISQLYSPLYSYGKANPASDPNANYLDNSSSKGTYDGKAKNGMIIPQFESTDKSTITFLTTSNRRKIAEVKESRFTWVRYSMRRSEKNDDEPIGDRAPIEAENELVRQTISTDIYASNLNWSDVKSQILMTQVKSIEFSFWNDRTKKFTTSVLDLNENKNAIHSIKMQLVWMDEDNHEQKVEKIFRILHPYYNTKLDDIKTAGAYGEGEIPPNLPNPNDVEGIDNANSKGSSGVHF